MMIFAYSEYMWFIPFKKTKSEVETGFLFQRQSVELEPVSSNEVLEGTKLWRSGGCRAKQELVAQS